jgi:predicted DNA-binding transcriptional regulator AlpA
MNKKLKNIVKKKSYLESFLILFNGNLYQERSKENALNPLKTGGYRPCFLSENFSKRGKFDMINTDTISKKVVVNKLSEKLLFDIHSEKNTVNKISELDHETLFKKRIWKIKDVASFLGCSIGHIYNLSSRDLIPKKKKGKCLYFDPREVLDWILQGDSL